MRIKRILRALAHPSTPHPSHKNHGNDPERGSSTRPPRRRSSRPRSQAPRGILDCSRQLDASRLSPPNGHPPHHSWGCWIFAGRAARSRSYNLIISTTEQHAAFPYQGSGHWRARGGEDRSWLSFPQGEACSNTISADISTTRLFAV